jgi:Kef-type K+ transport system membrane component KefB
MVDGAYLDTLLVALVGGTVLVAVLADSACSRLGIPSLVGYLLVGIALSGLNEVFGFIDPPVAQAFRFLADLGIVTLLFSVGLGSHPGALIAKLPAASLIWVGNVLVAGGLGYAAARYALNLELVPSLLVAVALTGTSVGVGVAPWQEAGALESKDGELLVDVAELDDISAIGLMALLLALAPVLLTGDGNLVSVASREAVWFVAKLTAFIACLVVFAKYGEWRVTRFSARLRRPPERMLVVAGIGFLIAAAASGLGFSLAVGALFAGLVFSGDPEAVKTEPSFKVLSAFVTPFFFIGIGLNVELGALPGTAWPIAILFVAAVLGKLVGTLIPALFATSLAGALLIAVSMIPRAEIAMVVVDQGRQMFPQLISGELYSAMVVVSIATCILATVLVRRILDRRGT